ncbi:MAG TPA: glycosyltransferase family 4 protein, partial [Pseudobdellovibrionaceae bacterium]
LWPQSVPLMKISKAQGAKVFFEFVECVSRSVWIDIQRKSTIEDVEPLVQKFVSCLVTECAAANMADGCIALTPEDSSFVTQIMRPKSIDIFPTGISQFAVLDKLKEYRAGLAESEKSAIFVGYYDHTPNIEGLDWYFKEVHLKIIAAIPEFKVKIVGRGSLTPLKEKYRSLPGIEWIGEVADIVPHILSSYICISPLISGAGLRGKIIQYSMLCRPTVSTPIGVCGTPFVDNKSVVIADTPEAFARGVIKLIGDNDFYEKIAASAKAEAEVHFSWAPVIEKMEIFLRG